MKSPRPEMLIISLPVAQEHMATGAGVDQQASCLPHHSVISWLITADPNSSSAPVLHNPQFLALSKMHPFAP